VVQGVDQVRRGVPVGCGLLGAVGFTVSAGLITTVDLTLDPGKLEDSDPELSLLSYLRGRQGSAAERIITEALSWPGVQRANGEFGSVVLRIGRRELGHLHGDAVADVPLAPRERDQLVTDAAPQAHQPRHDPGWVTVPLETDEGVQQALALLRDNYERAQA
jgi:hypothetical protein